MKDDKELIEFSIAILVIVILLIFLFKFTHGDIRLEEDCPEKISVIYTDGRDTLALDYISQEEFDSLKTCNSIIYAN